MCMYLWVCVCICVSSQPLKSFRINISGTTGKTTSRAVYSEYLLSQSLKAKLIPFRNPLDQPKPHKCKQPSFYWKPLSVFGKSTTLGRPADQPKTCFVTHQTTTSTSVTIPIKWLSPALSFLKTAVTSLWREYTWHTSKCVFTFQFRKLLTDTESF